MEELVLWPKRPVPKNNACAVEIKIKWIKRKQMTHENTYRDDMSSKMKTNFKKSVQHPLLDSIFFLADKKLMEEKRKPTLINPIFFLRLLGCSVFCFSGKQ